MEKPTKKATTSVAEKQTDLQSHTLPNGRTIYFDDVDAKEVLSTVKRIPLYDELSACYQKEMDIYRAMTAQLKERENTLETRKQQLVFNANTFETNQIVFEISNKAVEELFSSMADDYTYYDNPFLNAYVTLQDLFNKCLLISSMENDNDLRDKIASCVDISKIFLRISGELRIQR